MAPNPDYEYTSDDSSDNDNNDGGSGAAPASKSRPQISNGAGNRIPIPALIDDEEEKEGAIPLEDLRKWSLCTFLEEDFLSQVKIVYVARGNAFFVTLADEVFALGTNVKGRLGVGPESIRHSSTPLRMSALARKGVKDFKYAGQGNEIAFFALTEDGKLYSWGSNKQGQLGNANIHVAMRSSPVVVNCGYDQAITSFATGTHHVIAITENGKVYGWGCNEQHQLGLGADNKEKQFFPKVVDGTSAGWDKEQGKGMKIVGAACAGNHTCVFSNTGKVFVFGNNDMGQLGNGASLTDLYLPRRVPLLQDSLQVTKVVTNQRNTFLLTKDGEVYAAGYNEQQQISSDSGLNIPAYVKIVRNLHVEDIELMHKTLVLKTPEGFYVSGEIGCRGNWSATPLKLKLKACNTFHDVFAAWLGVEMMHKPLNANNFPRKPKTKGFWNIFQDAFLKQSEEGTDVEFEVEGKRIKAHKAILILSSSHFAACFSGLWAHEKKDESVQIVKIPMDIRYETMYGLLYYIYTSKIYFPHDDWDNIIDLLQLADSYFKEDLRNECEQILKQSITPENVFYMYKAAAACNAMDLKHATFTHAIKNWRVITAGGFLLNSGLSTEEVQMFTQEWAKLNNF